jgi:GAF domain-containing protein/methyl-accepting chemotaxis protein
MMRTRTNRSQSARSLTTTLALAFTTLSAVLLLASGGFTLYASIQRQQAIISTQQQLVAQEASKEVSGFFEEKYRALEATTRIVQLPRGSAEEKKLILESLLATQPSFRQMILLNVTGESAGEVSRVSLELSKQFLSQLQLVLSNPIQPSQRYISQIYFDDVTHEPLIILAIPINIWDFQGTLAAEVNLQFMWTLVDQLRVGTSGYAYLVDEEGNLIAFRDTARVLAGENVRQINKVSEFIVNQTSAAEPTPDIETFSGLLGERVLGTYVPLGTPQWAVVTELPYSEAYAPIFQNLTSTLATVLIMGFLAGLAGVILARRLAIPVIDLTETATRIADGETQLKATVAGTKEVASLATAFNTMTDQLRSLIGNLEQRVQERTNALEKRASQLQTVSDLARTITSVHDIHTLLPDVARLVSNRFGYYHVGIFLLDDAHEFAVLRAANSEGGAQMLNRQHKLKLDSNSIVGFVTSRNEPRVALDVGADSVYFDNPDLPNTRSEMALPLRISGRVTGALDVQSTQPNAFSEEDVAILTVLADQIAIAIENARLFSASTAALSESERTFERYIKQEWGTFASQAKSTGYMFDGNRILPVKPKGQQQEKVKALAQTGRLSLEKESSEITVPIRLRGQTVGFLEVNSKKGSRQWTRDEITLLESAAERAALALENARLVETAQRRASRERAIGEISSRIGAVTDVDAIMQMAVEELGRKISGAMEVTIELGEAEEHANS